MNEEKTIKHLNSKVWYRLIKVICIFFFFLAILVTFVLIYFAYSPKEITDYSKTIIKCNNGKQYSSENIGIYSKDYISESSKNQIKQLCTNENNVVSSSNNNIAIPSVEGALQWAKNNPNNPTAKKLLEASKDGTLNSLINQRILENKKNEFNKLLQEKQVGDYELIFHSETEGSWESVLKYSIIAIFIYFIIFRFFQSIFYYIVLGNFRPKK